MASSVRLPLPKTGRAKSTPLQASEIIPKLLPAKARSVKGEARLRLKPTEKEEVNFENSVWNLVYSLLPVHITVGQDPEVHVSSNLTFRPDLLASFDESTVLLIECKLTKSDAFVSAWISELRNLKRELEKTLGTLGYRNFVYVLAVQDKEAFSDHIRKDAQQLRIKFVNQREIDYFRDLQKACGIGVKHLFWATVAPWMIRHKEERLPALRVKTGKGHEVYIFSANAHDLLSRAFVSHRELHQSEEVQTGYQRMLQRKKLNETAKYIETFKVFPTPIVVAFQNPGFEPLPMAHRAAESQLGQVEFGHIKLPKDVKSIQIIDGQHRLYGYSRLPRSDDHVVHVVAYKRMRDQSPATMFVDINSKQTRVPSSLLWELYPDIYGEDEPDHYKAMISRVMESVAKKQLVNFVQHISSGMKGEISFHTLCAEIKRARLLDKEDKGLLKTEQQLALVLDAFFAALNRLDQQYPGVNRSFVYSNNGIAPVIRTMARVIRYEIGHNREGNLRKKELLTETFRDFFDPVYKHYKSLGETQLRELRKKRVGNAGSNIGEDEITGKIRDGYKNDFPYRRGKANPLWENAVGKFISLVDGINRQVIDSGRMNSWVFREFHGEHTKKDVLKPIDDSESFGTVLKVLYQQLIEGSGKEPDNRLANLLQVPRIYDLDSIAKLNTLRTCWEHKPEQVDKTKRQSALQALGELSKKEKVGGLTDLDPEEYQTTAISLVEKIIDEVLEPALAASNRSVVGR